MRVHKARDIAVISRGARSTKCPMERMHFLKRRCFVEYKSTFSGTLPVVMIAGFLHTLVEQATTSLVQDLGGNDVFSVVETAKVQASYVLHTCAKGCKKLGCFVSTIKADTLYSPTPPPYIRVCVWVCVCTCVWLSEESLQTHFSGTFHLSYETGSPLIQDFR